MNLRRYLPSAQWLPAYRREDLSSDVIAGLTVAVMLVPQAMAYAMLAGLPPVVGLYASTVPMILYAFFGTSRQLAVGPVAMDSLLVMIGVGALATPGSAAFISYALTLMLMVGAIQLILGLLRAGFVVNFLSGPVINGFMSAAALIIGTSQLKHLLGIDLPRGQVHETWMSAASQLADVSGATLAIGVLAIATIKGLKRFAPRIPSALVVVVGGTLAVVGLGLDEAGVAIIGDVPGGLPPLSMPDVSLSTLTTLFPIAFAIAVVAFMEAISVARFFAQKHKYTIDPSQELIALGMANLGGAFFSGYPVTGGLSRSAVADQAGARTNLAALVTAASIVLVLLALTPLFHSLPKAVLAAIIMVAVMKLFNVAEARHLWRTDRVDFGTMMITFAATLGLGIQQGIMVGVAVSIFVFVARRTRPHYAVLGRLAGEAVWRNVAHHPDAQCAPDVLVLRFDVSFYFGNVQFLKDRINAELDQTGTPPHLIVLDMHGVNALDSSASAMLLDLIEQLEARGVTLHLAAVKVPVQRTIERFDRLASRLRGKLFLTVDKAVGATLNATPDAHGLEA